MLCSFRLGCALSEGLELAPIANTRETWGQRLHGASVWLMQKHRRHMFGAALVAMARTFACPVLPTSGICDSSLSIVADLVHGYGLRLPRLSLVAKSHAACCHPAFVLASLKSARVPKHLSLRQMWQTLGTAR